MIVETPSSFTGKTPSFLDLLPRLYRAVDEAEGNGEFAALTGVLDEARGAIEGAIAQLYDDWFVGTCHVHILPEIARLAGWEGPQQDAADPRALVALRRRFEANKGTAAMAESWLAAVGGWPVRVATEAESARPVVRLFQQRLRRLHAASPGAAPEAGDGCFHFHPLGLDTPLFRHAEGEPPVPLRRSDDERDVTRNVEVRVKDASGAWRRLDIAVADLSEWAPGDAQGPQAVVDPELGRLCVSGESLDVASILVSAAIAEPLPPGPPAAPTQPTQAAWIAHVHAVAPAGENEGVWWFNSLAAALEAAAHEPGDCLIRLCDSTAQRFGEATLDDGGDGCPVQPNGPKRIAIEALEGETPTLCGDLRLRAAGRGIAATLRGVTLDGEIELSGAVAAQIEGCLVHALARRGRALREGLFVRPQALTLRQGDGGRPRVVLRGCAIGPVEAFDGAQVEMKDTIVDGYGVFAALRGDGALRVERSTLLGDVFVDEITAIDSLFAGRLVCREGGAMELAHCVTVAGGGAGAMRACELVDGDEPEFLQQHALWFLCEIWLNRPGYATLRRDRAGRMRQLASDGGEIGAMNRLALGRREAIVEAALSEVVPLGVEARIEVVG